MDEPKLILHIGQRMITVADELDLRMEYLGDAIYWDEGAREWKANGRNDFLNGRFVECLNRMHYEPVSASYKLEVVKPDLTTEGGPACVPVRNSMTHALALTTPASDPDDLPYDDGPEEPWCWGPGSPEHETNQCLHNGRDE